MYELQGELLWLHFVRRPFVVNICSCEHSTVYSLHPIIMKVYQNIHLDDFLDKYETGSCLVKTRSLGQI